MLTKTVRNERKTGTCKSGFRRKTAYLLLTLLCVLFFTQGAFAAAPSSAAAAGTSGAGSGMVAAASAETSAGTQKAGTGTSMAPGASAETSAGTQKAGTGTSMAPGASAETSAGTQKAGTGTSMAPGNSAETSAAGLSGLTADITYGYENSAKGGRYLPLSVTYGNAGTGDFSGKVRIYTRESDDDVYEYDYPVYVRAGEKAQDSYYIPLGTGADQMYLNLSDRAGTKVLSKRIKLNVSASTPELFVGVLSDTPDRLRYLDDVSVNYGQLKTKTFDLTGDTFPDSETGLNLLDVILISNYKIRDLSAVQTRSLMQWVRDGGVMILGTGSRVDDTLGRFAPELLDDMYDAPETREIILSDAPGGGQPGEGTRLSVPAVSFSLHGGNVVIPGNGISLISAVNKGNGLIAAAAYDFTDLSDYASGHSAYVNTLFSRILGNVRMDRLAQEAYGTDYSAYWSAQSLINLGENGKIPDMKLYIIAILAYILLVGPGLYLFLQERNLGRYYPRGVLLLSVCFTAAIYLMGSRTRFRSTFYNYATILDSNEDSVSETTYLNLRNPYNASYRVNVRQDYSVLPLTKSVVSEKKLSSLTGEENSNVTISYGNIGADGNADTSVSVADVGAFSSKFFELSRTSDNTDGSGFSGDVSLFEKKYSGTVTNHYAFRVTDVALVFYGKVIPLGDFEPGESKEIGSGTLYNTPLNNAYAVASLVTGMSGPEEKAKEKGRADSGKSLLKMERTNLLSFFLSNAESGYSADARVVAFSDTPLENDIIMGSRLENSGITLLTSSLQVNSKEDDRLYRSALLKNPTVLSGDYTAATNSTYAGEPVVLEYSLGNDISVDRISFESADPVFLKSEARTKVNMFEGTVSFYNYATGNFDDMDLKNGSFSAEELSDYLSPGNTVSVRYADTGSTVSRLEIVLPMLTVVGRVK